MSLPKSLRMDADTFLAWALEQDGCFELIAGHIDDLRTRLDAEQEERRSLVHRLLPAPQAHVPERRGFFRWFAAKGS